MTFKNPQFQLNFWQLYLLDDDWEDDVLQIAILMGIAGKYFQNLNRTRHYLTRNALLPNPRIDTPWQFLYSSNNDKAYINTMGVDCAVFKFILESGFEELWNTTCITRGDVSSSSVKPWKRSLDAAGGLGISTLSSN
jgi:hypothetical protein